MAAPSDGTGGPRVVFVRGTEATGDPVADLEAHGVRVDATDSVAGMLRRVEEGPVDCVVSNFEVESRDGLEYLGGLDAIRALDEARPDLPFVLYTSVANADVAAEALGSDVFDYIPHRRGDDSSERLRARVEAAANARRGQRRAREQERINRLIREINDALVRERTREGIERAVVDRLTSTGGYAAAWVATVTGETVERRAVAGADGLPTPIAVLARRAAGDDSVVERDPPHGALAAVPLSYGDRSYGVLVTAMTPADAFETAELQMLHELCENVALAMDAAQTREELERQNERLEEFASVVSHDLRNPLNVATGATALAREDHDVPELDHVAEALDRMDELITDLLALARQGRTVGETEALSLRSMADAAWSAVDTADAGLDVRADATVEADPSRLRQLLENLFRNAVEHAGDDAAVVVGPLPERDGFFVADDGPGVPAERRDEVFDSGFTTSDTGTGFGLAIVETIAEAHGWSVTVTDGEQGGARFEFRDVEVA